MVVGISSSLVGSQDPCDSTVLMVNLDDGSRSPNTTTSFDRANLCDYQLDESTYQSPCLVTCVHVSGVECHISNNVSINVRHARQFSY